MTMKDDILPKSLHFSNLKAFSLTKLWMIEGIWHFCQFIFHAESRISHEKLMSPWEI